MDGVFIFDASWELTEWNEGANLMVGEESKHLHKMNFDQLFYTHQQEKHLLLSNEECTSIKIDDTNLVIDKDTTLPVSLTLSVIPNRFQSGKKFAVIVRDLTERKQMEEVIKDLYKEASQKQFEAETQYRIAKKIASIRDITANNKQQVYNYVVEEVHKIIRKDFIGLALFNYTTNLCELVAITDNKYRSFVFEHFSDLNFSEKSGDTQEAIVEIDQMTFVPLENKNKTFGHLVIGGSIKHTSLLQQELVKSVVNILTISFENIHLYKQSRGVAILEERERLAREMHDGLAQTIGSIHMKLEVLKFMMNNESNPTNEISENINELTEFVNSAYAEVRDNLFNLRFPAKEGASIASEIKKYTEYFNRKNNIRVHFNTKKVEEDFKLEEYTRIHIIRILQEALANVRKHSSATEVRINISSSHAAKDFILEVEDNGNGFDSRTSIKEGHYGLSTMKERSELINGSLLITSEINKGTKVSLQLPMKEDYSI